MDQYQQGRQHPTAEAIMNMLNVAAEANPQRNIIQEAEDSKNHWNSVVMRGSHENLSTLAVTAALTPQQRERLLQGSLRPQWPRILSLPSPVGCMAPSGATPIDPALLDISPAPTPTGSAETSAVLAMGSSISNVPARAVIPSAVVLSAITPLAVLPKAVRRSKATITCTDPDTQNTQDAVSPAEAIAAAAQKRKRKSKAASLANDNQATEDVRDNITDPSASKKRKRTLAISTVNSSSAADDTAKNTGVSKPAAVKKRKAYKPQTTTVHRGRKISALSSHWVDGRLEIIPEGIAVASTMAHLSSNNATSALASDASFPPITIPVADNQTGENVIPSNSAIANAPGSAPVPEPEPRPTPYPRLPLVHPLDPGVDVFGPPDHTGPHDPDYDVQPAPSSTRFPTQGACVHLCMLPKDRSLHWNQQNPADVLRAVRRFRHRYPWAFWEEAEDYIFSPHHIRHWNPKNSKAVSATGADAVADQSAVATIACDDTTSVGTGYALTGNPAAADFALGENAGIEPSQEMLAMAAAPSYFVSADPDDGALFLPCEAMDEDEDVVFADDYNPELQTALLEMNADRATPAAGSAADPSASTAVVSFLISQTTEDYTGHQQELYVAVTQPAHVEDTETDGLEKYDSVGLAGPL
ncbi:hypothetical protein FPQ18DRAFT_307883 [Pyronema domesticum]|nr:hypothetical protein FPQ18DRAFT_307883 [Pyronema domesticum]